jgi:hypothetical protein
MSDTDIEYDDDQFSSDDDQFNSDERHEEERDEEEMLHAPIPREKRYNTITGPALSVPALNDNVVVEESDTPLRDDGTGRLSRANVKPKQAKEQRKAALDDEMKTWREKLKADEGMRVASGFKPKGKAVKPIVEETEKAEPFHIKVAIEKGWIKGDKSRLNETLYEFINDFNEIADAFRTEIDHGIQKDSHGRLVFEGAMTLDRKQRAVAREDGQEENGSEDRARVRTAISKKEAEKQRLGYDAAVRTITSIGAVDCAGYNPARGDLLLAERIADTKQRVEEVTVFVGPLLPELLKAVFENTAASAIGESLALTGPQASAVGHAMLQRALEAAGIAYDRIKKRERGKLTYTEWLAKQPDDMPIPARKLKQVYAKRAAAKSEVIAEVDQAIAHVGIVKHDNDNLPLTFEGKTAAAAA